MPNLLTEFVLNEIGTAKKEVFTGFPATVVEYDNQYCRVKPALNIRYPDGDVIELPEVSGVPVNFAAGGGGILSFPVRVDDTVWVQCSMVALDEWLQAYQRTLTPSTRRMHALNDAVVTGIIATKDRRLGVDPDHIQLKFHKPPQGESPNYSGETWNSLTLKNDGAIEITTDNNQNLFLNQDGSIVVENTDAGNKIDLKSDGTVEVTTASTVKIQNGSEELVNLLSEVVGLLADTSQTTTNTSIGPMPLNSAAALSALRTRIDTLKG